MNDLAKNLIVWVILAAILMSVFNSFTPQPVDNSLDYSDFVLEVQNERVSSISIDGLIIEGERRDGSKFRTVRPNVQDPGLMDDLLNHNVKVVGKEPETPSLISASGGSISNTADTSDLCVFYAPDAGRWWR